MNPPNSNQTGRKDDAYFRWRGFCFSVAVVLVSLLNSDARSAQHSAREAMIRTGYIHNFTKYVSWPEAAFENPESPFIIGVYGSSDLDRYLKELANRRTVGKRKIKFKRFTDLKLCGNCHLLYVQTELSDKEGRRLAEALDGTYVLAVGESPSFLRQGGTIRFLVRNNLLNLELSVETAKLRKHSVRSQLLRLDVVHRVK